jgi:hypothetical protein
MPLIKLVGLLIKSLSKPIAGYVKNHLQDSPSFAKSMANIGKKYQLIANKITKSNSSTLSNDRAITLGSEIVVESLFFGIGGGLVYYENHLSKQKSNEIDNRINKLEQHCFNNNVV